MHLTSTAMLYIVGQYLQSINLEKIEKKHSNCEASYSGFCVQGLLLRLNHQDCVSYLYFLLLLGHFSAEVWEEKNFFRYQLTI